MTQSRHNPVWMPRYRLEAQMRANGREQAEIRHKLLFSKYPYHQSPEGQKILQDELASLERVFSQLKAKLAALD